jgi:hypothetical protein
MRIPEMDRDLHPSLGYVPLLSTGGILRQENTKDLAACWNQIVNSVPCLYQVPGWIPFGVIGSRQSSLRLGHPLPELIPQRFQSPT